MTDSVALVADRSPDIRTISYLLHPPLLDEAGLASAQRWNIEGFAERGQIGTVVGGKPACGGPLAENCFCYGQRAEGTNRRVCRCISQSRYIPAAEYAMLS